MLRILDLRHGVAQPGQHPDDTLDPLLGADRPADLTARCHRDVVGADDVRGVGCRDQQHSIVEERDGDRAPAMRLSGIDQVDGTLVDLEDVEVDVVE